MRLKRSGRISTHIMRKKLAPPDVIERLADHLSHIHECLERLATACENIAESTDFIAATSEGLSR